MPDSKLTIPLFVLSSLIHRPLIGNCWSEGAEQGPTCATDGWTQAYALSVRIKRNAQSLNGGLCISTTRI